MAERRMFAKTIIDSDAFIDMPITARLLYYDLGMRADDDGFVNSPKKIMRMVGASEDDMRILITRKFIIPFESGVVVIKHWRIHNYIQNDRHKETPYKEELSQLELDENKAYRLSVNDMDTKCIQDVSSLDTQDRLGKDRLGKDRLNNKEPYFPFPDVEEVFQEFLSIRKRLKAVNSERAIKSLVNKIYEYSNGDTDKAIEIITQSIENSWKGIFPLKGQKPKQTQTNYFLSQTGVQP